jgi:DNA-binding response OmpR family regulator
LADTDGYEVYSELTSTQQTRHIPVIFLTRIIDDDLKAASRETRKLDYISKPFDLDELGRRIQDALRQE